MTTVTSQCSNNIYCRQHDHSSPAHQLQYSVQLLYHHPADPLGDLQAHIRLNHHLNDNHQPQIALLASSDIIELVSSSARVTSVKFHKVPEVQRPGHIDRTPETPGSGKKLKDGSVSNHDWVYSLSKMTNIALDNSCYLGLQLYLSRGWRTQVQSSAPPQTPP